MKISLPHIILTLEDDNSVVLSIKDHELFDFVEDYFTEECDLGDKFLIIQSQNRSGTSSMHFGLKASLAEIEQALNKLDPKEILRIYALNN